MEDKKHPNRKKFQKAATLPFRTKVLEMCSQRMDYWAREVDYRVLDCHDFVAAKPDITIRFMAGFSRY